MYTLVNVKLIIRQYIRKTINFLNFLQNFPYNAAIKKVNIDDTLKLHMYGLMQDCSNFSVLAMELLQSCTEPLIR